MISMIPSEKQNLDKYKKQIKRIQGYYKRSKLNSQHKQRLDNFVNRAIKYCETQKEVTYVPAGRRFKNEPYTIFQKDVYEKILANIIKLQRNILKDRKLSNDQKEELCKCLSYAVGHLRGRLHSKFKEGYYARNK